MATPRLDQQLQQRRCAHERARQDVLQRVWQWLDRYGQDFGIQQAYVFGSVCRPGHFHDRSDVDIAVTSIHPERYFMAISLLSAWLEREVDLIELDRCPFHHRIRESQWVWTAPIA